MKDIIVAKADVNSVIFTITVPRQQVDEYHGQCFKEMETLLR